MDMIKQIESIYKRTSVRSFSEKSVSKEMIYNIIKAGTYAPSRGNMQPGEFVIVQGYLKKKELIRSTFSGFYSNNSKYQSHTLDDTIIIDVCTSYHIASS